MNHVVPGTKQTATQQCILMIEYYFEGLVYGVHWWGGGNRRNSYVY